MRGEISWTPRRTPMASHGKCLSNSFDRRQGRLVRANIGPGRASSDILASTTSLSERHKSLQKHVDSELKQR